MSDYCRLNLMPNKFTLESWIVLNPIEKRIKDKIERVGTPLRDWDIQINYGIKTGFNEAFIINGKTKDALIEKSAKNAEIIRPILRGRDIKRYKADFADLWIINTHNGTITAPPINIDDYPHIKEHLDKFYPALEKRQDKGVTPYHLRSCIYTDDFSKQKIVWGEISDISKFAFDLSGYYPEATSFFMTGNHLKYLLGILNSKLGEWLFNQIGTTTGVGTNRWKKYTLEMLLVKVPNQLEEAGITILIDKIICNMNSSHINEIEELNTLIYSLYDLSEDEIDYIKNI